MTSIAPHRVLAVLWHSWVHTTHSKETWIDLVWFTVIQFGVFGLIARYLASSRPEIVAALLAGFLLWEIVRIGQYCVTVSLLWEVWSRSFNNLFVSPLTMTEWLLGQMLGGVLKTTLVITLLSLWSSVAFHFSLLALGWWLIPIVFCLMTFAFAAGVFVTGLLIRFGTNIQSLAWGLIYIFQPFSAVFYPVKALPSYLRVFAYISPVTYVMEHTRHWLETGEASPKLLGIGLVVSVAYFALAWWFLQSMYRWSKRTGEFARLGN